MIELVGTNSDKSPVGKYFCGTGPTDNTPKPIPGCETFAKFVTEHLSHPVVCYLSSADYHALDDKAKKRAKACRYFCAAAFGGEGLRRIRNVTAAHLLVLDVDTGTKPLLDADLETLLPWNYALFSTLTSTPEAPRLRLIVDTEPLTPGQYRAGTAWLAAHLGLTAPNPNPESLNVAALWYMPSTFSDRATDVPIISSRINGEPISPAVWGAPTVQEDEPKMPAPAPVESASLEQAEEMLLFIDPDAEGMLPWLKVGMGLKHQFGEDGFPLWLNWSQRGAKYGGIKEVEDKWGSFKRTDEIVTYRSLIKRAKAAGWTSGASRLKAEKLIATSTSVDELLGPILASIHASAFSPTDEDILVGKIRARAADHHKAKLRASTIRTALGDLTKKRTSIPTELQGWVYVAEIHQWVHPIKGVRITPTAFDLLFSSLGVNSHEALNTLRLPTVAREGYDPTRPNELIYKDDCGVEQLNCYRKSYPEADPGTSPLAGEILNGHLTLLFPDAHNRDLLLSWVSWILLNPGKKCRFAVFIQGAPGCGKSLVAEAFRTCFGRTNSRKVSNTMVSEKYNSWISNTLFAFFEEILVGDHQKTIMESLKDLITGETSNIRAMRTDAVERANMLNGMFLSNHPHGLRLDHGDRRFFCLCACLREEQVKEIPREHFVQLARLQTDLAGGLRHYLLTRPISKEFNPFSHAPNTPDRELVMRAGASEVDHAVSTAIESAEHPMISDAVLSMGALTAIVRSELRYTSAKQISRILTEMGWLKAGQRLLDNGERHSLWWHPAKLAKDVLPVERMNQMIDPEEI